MFAFALMRMPSLWRRKRWVRGDNYDGRLSGDYDGR